MFSQARILPLLLAVGCNSTPPLRPSPMLPVATGPTQSAASASTNVRVTSAAEDDARIATLLRALDENPDPLHSDITPSVIALARFGARGALAVVGLLDAPSADTRLHAWRVIETVLSAYCRTGAAAQARAVIEANGTGFAARPPAERAAAKARWVLWLEGRFPERCVQVRLGTDGAGRAPPCPGGLDRAWHAALERAARPLLKDLAAHDEWPDAVHALINYGIEAAWAVVDQLDAPDPTLRARCEHVLTRVVEYEFSREADDRAARELTALGYHYDAPPSARLAAQARIRAWLQSASVVADKLPAL